MVTHGAVEEERDETFEGGFVVEDAGTTIHAYRQEIRDVSVAVRPHAMQSAEAAWWRFIGDAV
jgi:hypothetical protein